MELGRKWAPCVDVGVSIVMVDSGGTWPLEKWRIKIEIVITTENGGRHRIMIVRDQKLMAGRKTGTQLWTLRQSGECPLFSR